MADDDRVNPVHSWRSLMDVGPGHSAWLLDARFLGEPWPRPRDPTASDKLLTQLCSNHRLHKLPPSTRLAASRGTTPVVSPWLGNRANCLRPRDRPWRSLRRIEPDENTNADRRQDGAQDSRCAGAVVLVAITGELFCRASIELNDLPAKRRRCRQGLSLNVGLLQARTDRSTFLVRGGRVLGQ